MVKSFSLIKKIIDDCSSQLFDYFRLKKPGLRSTDEFSCIRHLNFVFPHFQMHICFNLLVLPFSRLLVYAVQELLGLTINAISSINFIGWDIILGDEREVTFSCSHNNRVLDVMCIKRCHYIPLHVTLPVICIRFCVGTPKVMVLKQLPHPPSRYCVIVCLN